MTVREFNRENDLQTVRGWWGAHGAGHFPDNLLPPIGIIVERDGRDLAALWLYLAAGIGVCWIEYPVSAPGLHLRVAADAFEVAITALEDIARTHDYSVMIAHTLPAIARVLTRSGFHVERQQKLTVIKQINGIR